MSTIYPTCDFGLTSDAAKMLYHQYAATLPVVISGNLSNISPQNAADLFLSSSAVQSAMRAAAIAEVYITGTASDYEKFRALCKAMPDLIGHPVYLAAHLLLRRLFDCPLMLTQENCDAIWQTTADQLSAIDSWTDIFRRLQITCFLSSTLVPDNAVIRPLFIPQAADASTLAEYEAALRTQLAQAQANGTIAAQYTLPPLPRFVRPDPYHADLAHQKQAAHLTLDDTEAACLAAQLLRTIGRECVSAKMTLLLSVAHHSNPDALDELLFYLDEIGALPQTILCLSELYDRRIFKSIPLALSCHTPIHIPQLSHMIEAAAAQTALGHLVGLIGAVHCPLDLLQPELFRRALCDALGRMAESQLIPYDIELLGKTVEAVCGKNAEKLLLG